MSSPLADSSLGLVQAIHPQRTTGERRDVTLHGVWIGLTWQIRVLLPALHFSAQSVRVMRSPSAVIRQITRELTVLKLAINSCTMTWQAPLRCVTIDVVMWCVVPICMCSLLAYRRHTSLQVLLPYVPEQSGVRTNFTLKSQNGCFQWYNMCRMHEHTPDLLH